MPCPTSCRSTSSVCKSPLPMIRSRSTTAFRPYGPKSARRGDRKSAARIRASAVSVNPGQDRPFFSRMAFGFRSAAKKASGAPDSRVSQDSVSIGPPAKSQSMPVESDGERALDTLGAVLRALGSAAFDLEELDAGSIRESFDRWAQHVLVAAPLSRGGDRELPVQREWAAVRQFVASHRTREVAFVQKTLTSLREVIWNFVAIVNRAAGEDQQHGLIARESTRAAQGGPRRR